jgi:hypothetical protein
MRWIHMRKKFVLVLSGLAIMVIVGTNVLTPADAASSATTRPIEDFLNAQTLGDIVDWVSNPSQTDPSYRTRIDFTGAIHRLFVEPNGADFGTTFSGTVTERPRGDGRTEVHVVLLGRSVFYMVGTQPGLFPILSGRLAGQAVFQNLPVDVCTTRYDLKFITTNAPGAPMPRLAPLLFNTPDDWDVLQSKLTANGAAELRAAFGVDDGTPGRFTLNMNGLIHPKGGDITTGDTFAVANIDLNVVGE